jgi:arylsulfatase A-like enzyme/tetratricopeptide (TPR) repeat protein
MARSRRQKHAAVPAAPQKTSTTRRVVAGVVVFALVGAAGWWWRSRPPAFALPQDSDQNVLVVTIDTLRADALGADGGRATTPHLDALAAHGARFTFAHASAPITLPSHATIFTGLYPYQHGVRDNRGYRLAATIPTMATRLKALGFATGGFIGAFPLTRRFGLDTGFDVYDDRVGEVGSAAVLSETQRRADAVVKVATDWIDRQDGKWFAWVHVYDPHAPYTPPAEWQARYPSNPYLGEVSWTDAALGVLFDRVRAQPRQTLVVVTADHGEALGDHGELTHGVFAYEATLRIPLIVSEIAAGSVTTETGASRGVVIDAPVRHVDLLPTVLDAVGAPADTTLPGASVRNLIAGGAGPDRPNYFEAMMTNLGRAWAPLRGVLVGREKYIDLPIPEFYDLGTDPAESDNLAAASSGRVAVLANVLRGYDTAPVNRPSQESAAVNERLRALGYVGTGPSPARESYTERDDPKRLIDLDRKLHDATDAYEAGRSAEAIALLKDVLAERPDTAEAALDLAVAYWSDGQQDEAIQTLEAVIRNGATQREVRVKLGLCLALSGRSGRAIEVLEGLATDDVDALNALGLAYAAAGRPADAKRTFTQVLAIDPGSGLAYENIASVEIKQGNYAAAETALRRAISLDSTLTGAQTDLGTLLAQTGRVTEAIAAWKQAVDVDREAYSALYNLTLALEQSGRHEEARTYGRRFVDTAPAATYAPQIAQVRKLIGS